MRERLTDNRIAHGGFIEYKNYDKFAKLPNVREIYDRLCELEDKIEQGKIVELPCSVGDTLFGIYHSPKRKVCVFEYEVTEIVYCSNRGVRPWVVSCFGGRKFDNCDFGKTVFLDRAEAEK